MNVINEHTVQSKITYIQLPVPLHGVMDMRLFLTVGVRSGSFMLLHGKEPKAAVILYAENSDCRVIVAGGVDKVPFFGNRDMAGTQKIRLIFGKRLQPLLVQKEGQHFPFSAAFFKCIQKCSLICFMD